MAKLKTQTSYKAYYSHKFKLTTTATAFSSELKMFCYHDDSFRGMTEWQIMMMSIPLVLATDTYYILFLFQALSVHIFPYVLKLLQSSARELRPLLVFIWAKILAVDSVSNFVCT